MKTQIRIIAALLLALILILTSCTNDSGNNEKISSENKINTSPVSITNDENKIGVFYLGMKYDDLMSLDLYNTDYEITETSEVTEDKNAWNYGHKSIWTQLTCCLFDNENTLYSIIVNDETPSHFGINVGDSIDKLEQQYGKSDRKYKFDWGEVQEYDMGSYFLNVSIQGGKILLWGISKYKYDYTGEDSTTLQPNEEKSNDELDFIANVLNAIKNKDAQLFRKLSDPDGIFVSRAFISGNGTRGKDLIMNIKPNAINDDISFSVEGETSIDMNFLFQESTEMDINKIKSENVDTTIDLESISYVDEIWGLCWSIANEMEDKNWESHLIDINENQFVLFEEGDSEDTGIGGWMIIEKKSGNFYITGIFDLR